MTKQDLIKEFQTTKSIMGIPITPEQQRALRYASIRLEQLDENSDLKNQLAESEKVIKYLKGIKKYDIGEMLTENTKLKQQLAEKEDKCNKQWLQIQTDTEYIQQLEKKLKQEDKLEFAIAELEKVNGILTNTIIEVTQEEFDLNRLCYLEEISAKFCEQIDTQIKTLKESENNKYGN